MNNKLYCFTIIIILLSGIPESYALSWSNNNAIQDGQAELRAPSSYTKQTGTSVMIRTTYCLSANCGVLEIERGFVEWDISALAGFRILSVVFIYEGGAIADYMNITSLLGMRPSTSGAEDLYNAIGNGAFYTDGITFPDSGENQNITLNALAVSELQSSIDDNVTWFSLGFIMPESGGTRSNSILNENNPGGPTPNPTLYVTYEIPNPTTLTLTAGIVTWTNQLTPISATLETDEPLDNQLLTFYVSPDNITWTKILSKNTNVVGNANFMYGHELGPGLFYFQARYLTDGNYESSNSSIRTLTYRVQSGSTPPAYLSETPSSSPGVSGFFGDPLGSIINTVSDSIDSISDSIGSISNSVGSIPGSIINTVSDSIGNIWNSILGGDNQQVDQTVDQQVDQPLPLETTGNVPIEDVNPIIKPIATSLLTLSGQSLSLQESTEGIIEVIPETFVNISWGLLGLLLLLIVLIPVVNSFKGKGLSFRG